MTGNEDIENTYEKLKKEAESAGYRFTPDAAFAKELIRGLLANEERYGYRACPCRLASGNMADDLDIICPCDYRDADMETYGACYCALYVSEAVYRGEQAVRAIPERRLPPEEQSKSGTGAAATMSHRLSYPVWRCKVCGYLCAREEAPGICPICKAKKERFERFM
ncbi:MAG: ferredoxin:glutaredoxin reductase [Syntrophus sp. (in: bacteria)]|nr:ferredoxin:glutaredoxin reductase [Syntrophus sp. (in: bacteria)]